MIKPRCICPYCGYNDLTRYEETKFYTICYDSCELPVTFQSIYYHCNDCHKNSDIFDETAISYTTALCDSMHEFERKERDINGK